MAAHKLDPRAIFQEAVENHAPEDWKAFLDTSCGDDTALRERVEVLLAAHGQYNEMLDGAGIVATLDPPPSERPGVRIGSYKLLQQIGEGGFGYVYMAEQLEPVQRRVALKVIKPGMDTRQVIARFEAERQALAVMDHPSIARVLDAGATDSGRPYFVMELVRGVPLTQYCDDNHLPIRERLKLFAAVCLAIQHAHTKGIIHRDIKPTNVMVTQQDGDPIVKVIDFGVAKAMGRQLTDKTLFTEFAQVIGTPLYMSPEQAAMSSTDIDTRSDIYSLGVLLYEVLTGTTPVCKEQLKQATFDEVRRIIREEEPLRPSTRIGGSQTLAALAAQRHIEPARLIRAVRGELDWIVMKCLEKDRNRRYLTASSLAADIERYLSDEPVQACPPSSWYRFRKFARRNKGAIAIASVASTAAIMLVVGLVISLVLIRDALKEATTARSKMESALRGEQETVEFGRREAYFQSITLAHHELSLDNLGRARQHLLACPADLQAWEWRYLQRLCLVEPLILRDDSEVRCIAFSPLGDRLVSGNKDGVIKLWDSRTGQELQSIAAHAQSVASLAFHPGGDHLASTGLDRLAKVWNMSTGEEVLGGQPCDALHQFGAGHTIAFGPDIDDRRLAFGHEGVVQIWDWKSRIVLNSFVGHLPRSISVVFNHRGDQLATGDWRGSVKLWDVAQEGSGPIRTLTQPPQATHPACALDFSLDDRRVASASFDRRVDVWETETGLRLHTLKHRDGLVLCVDFSPDGKRIASVGEDKTVHLWDAESGREVLGLKGHAGQCSCVSFSPDGHRLASASLDGTIHVWDATPLTGNERQEKLTFEGHDNEVWSVAVSPDGSQVVSAGFSTPAKVWDLATRQIAAPDFTGHADISFRVAWHPNGKQLASAGSLRGNFSFAVWERATGERVSPAFAIPSGPEFFNVTFSPAGEKSASLGKYLVTGRADGTIQVWEVDSGALARTLDHGDAIRCIAFADSGRQLVSLSSNGVVKVWDWDSDRVADPSWSPQPRTLAVRGHVPGPCSIVDFSPDGRLAVGAESGTVLIWDVAGDRLLQTLRGHSDDVYAVAFCPTHEGQWIATAGVDSTVRVWDSRIGGQPVRTFRGHTGLVTSLDFTPDGQRLVSGSRDRTVKVWDMNPLQIVADRLGEERP
jgi:WD40 repeat protein/serine/threonine protein kinase